VRLLMLGGTSFLGRHVVAEALRRGDDVTLFNRGRTGPRLFPEATHLRGDREGDLAALDGGTWDAVVDTCGFVARVVRASAERLADAVGHYTFVSSISVYQDPAAPGCDETRPVAPPDHEAGEVTMANYGSLKHACELEVERAMPGRTLVVRPGFIVGPYDTVPRLAYWLWRAARGGDMLAPGDRERPVQLVDARDIAIWILDMAGRGGTGVFNVTTPDDHLTMGAMIDEVVTVTGGRARPVWVDDARLEAGGIASDVLPFWFPRAAPGLMRISVARARAQGLRARPFADTARDTWAWLSTLPAESPPHARTRGAVSMTTGMTAADEARWLTDARG